MRNLVDRFGRTGFALLASLVWAIPLAAWAGSADLSPIDQTAYPKVALAIGLVMLVVWVFIVIRIRAVKEVAPKQHRFEISQMTRQEKRWTLAAAAFATLAIAWLNAAATVDWAPLTVAVQQGKPGPTVLAGALGVFLIAVVTGAALSWRKAAAAYRDRERTYK